MTISNLFWGHDSDTTAFGPKITIKLNTQEKKHNNDVFVSSEREHGDIKQCSIIDPYLKKAIDIFSPVIDFLTGQTIKEESLDKLDDLILATKDKTNNINLSGKSKSALDRIYAAVEKLEKSNNTDKKELRQLIEKWRTSKDHRILIETLNKIKEGKCLNNCNRHLKKVLSEGLETLADTFEEALSHPHSEGRKRTVEKLTDIADNHIDCIDKANEAKGELTKNEKRYICDKLSENKEKTEDLVNDETCCKFIENSKQKLTSWINLIQEFIYNNLIEEREKKIEEEKKAEKEKIKRKTEEEIDRIEDLCIRHHIAKEKGDKKYALKERAKDRLKRLINLGNLTNTSKNEITRLNRDIYYLEKEYTKRKDTEDYYKDEEDSLKIYVDTSCLHDEDPIEMLYEDDIGCA